jgi:hypothetical protein
MKKRSYERGEAPSASPSPSSSFAIRHTRGAPNCLAKSENRETFLSAKGEKQENRESFLINDHGKRKSEKSGKFPERARRKSQKAGKFPDKIPFKRL